MNLVGGGQPRTVDIPRLCHAWLPTGLDPARASTRRRGPSRCRVDLKQGGHGGRQVVLRAQAAAQAGTTGARRRQGQGRRRHLHDPGARHERAARIATLRPVTVEGLIAGTSQTVNLAQYLDSPLTSPQCSVQSSQVGLGCRRHGIGQRLPADGLGRRQGPQRQRAWPFASSTHRAARRTGQVTVTVRSKPDRRPRRWPSPTASSAARRGSTGARRRTTADCPSSSTRSSPTAVRCARPARPRRAPSPG